MLDLTFKLLSEIDPLHYHSLANLLKSQWGHLQDLRVEDLAERARQQAFTIVAYRPERELPIGLIQTVGLNSIDQLLHSNYHQLMALPQLPAPKLRVCMDITIEEEFWRFKYGGRLIAYTLIQMAATQPSVERVLTYTPIGTEGFHLKNGAKLAGITIDRARPGHRVESVIITDYTPKLNIYRQMIRCESNL